MSSQRRIDASRANGAKSKGPATPAGKSRSARNAVKHGLASPDATAQSVCLGAENRDEFTELHQALIDEFSPATATEALLVQEMAVARYRMQRAWEHEAALLDREMEKLARWRATDKSPRPDPDPVTAAALGFASLVDNGRALPALQRYEARLSHQFDRCLRRLEALRAAPLAGEAAAESSAPPQVQPLQPDQPAEPTLPNEPSPNNEHRPPTPPDLPRAA